MKHSIRELLIKANEEQDLELATIASNILYALTFSLESSIDWLSICEQLYEEFKDCEWIINSVYEFNILTEPEGYNEF